MRLLLLLGVLLSFVAAPALAQSPAPAPSPSPAGPVEVVRAFYEKDSIRFHGFYSKRLQGLFRRDERRAQRSGGLGHLDFAFHVDGQDTEEGWKDTLRLTLLTSEDKRAEVQAVFKNFTPHELRYSLVREAGQWRIDDVRSMDKDGWRLSTILK